MIAAVALAAAISAAQPGPSFTVFGGTDSCGHWLANPSLDLAMRQWILGFWSGLNYSKAAGGNVGRGSDADGVIGEVRLICTNSPSDNVATAVLQAYQKLERSHR